MHGSLFMALELKLGMLKEKCMNTRPDPNGFRSEYLKELENIGILKGHKIGKEVLYLNVSLYDLLSQ